MKPFNNLAQTRTPDGARFSLHEKNGEYSLKLNGAQLMSSGWTVSELALADEACRWREPKPRPRVLIGGLGLGFSLRRVLELVGKGAEVCQAELLPEVVAWNREFLMDLNGKLLDDPRVTVFTGDVFDRIVQAGRNYFDAILLDVDNGPSSLVQPQNVQLYVGQGLKTIHDSLRIGGRVAFWSADVERGFPRRLRRVGFETEEVRAKAYKSSKRAEHRIYVGERRR